MFDGVDGLATNGEEIDKTAWKCSGYADHVMHLLRSEAFKHLHGLLADSAF